MALINCPECSKEISDKAVNCPHCGYPLSNIPVQVEEFVEEKFDFPDFPKNLKIGRPIVNWFGDAYFNGKLVKFEYPIENINLDNIQVILFTQGIQLSKSYQPLLQIHFSQIIELSTLPQNSSTLMITFWDIKSRKKNILYILGLAYKIEKFIRRYENENKNKN